MQQGLLSAFNPSDALPAPRYTGMLLPIERDMYGTKGNFELAVPQFLQDAYSGINKFGQAFRGELSPEQLKQLAFDTSMNVTGGSLLGSRVIPNAVPSGGILGMGVSKTPNQTGLLGKVNKSSNIFGSVEKFPKLSKQEENLVSSSFAPVNEVAGFGKVKIEKINNQDLVGSQKRFEELKELTANYAHDRAKARVIRLDNGENAIQYMQPPTEIKNVNVSDLIATQDNIVLGTNKSSGSPLVVKKNGKLYIRDGHHRIAQKINAGDKTAEVRVIDLDEGGYYGMDKSATNTPETGLLGKTNQVAPETGLLGKVDNVQPKSGVSEVVPPTDKTDGIIAFHGSPYDFNKFSLSKIGTGEGNQAFGYGLYFTDTEDIAKFYKDAILKTQNVDFQGKPIKFLSDSQDIDNKTVILGKIRDRILGGKYNSKEAIDNVKYEYEQTINNNFDLSRPLNAIDKMSYNDLKKDLNFISSLDPKDFNYQAGKTYQVNLKTTTNNLLDYDKKLSDQPAILKKINNLIEVKTLKSKYNKDIDNLTGKQFYEFLEANKATPRKDAEVSKQLNEVGIKGIKYLDNSARNTFGGKLLSVDKTPDGFKAKVALDNPSRQTGVGGSGRVITTSKPYKTEKEARDWAKKSIEKDGSNYVIFDDKIIDIMKKYGIVGAVGVTAMQGGEQSPEANLSL